MLRLDINHDLYAHTPIGATKVVFVPKAMILALFHAS
jgi:hypothetical protein